ncbi:MAG: hypothetical protein LUF02_04390, partial [Erysipelotrichaceae bacterium]|nr:hypothetical protein [Erysipelotrichaceae bacterium]
FSFLRRGMSPNLNLMTLGYAHFLLYIIFIYNERAYIKFYFHILQTKTLSFFKYLCYYIDKEKEDTRKEVLKLKVKIDNKMLRPMLVENLDLPKDFRLSRDILPPNI